MKLLIVLVALAMATPAVAEDVVSFEVTGEAAVEVDAAAARARALDLAFAQAVQRAVRELAPARDLEARRSEVDQQIIARARLWVSSFRVTDEATANGALRLAATVRINREALRAGLAALGITAEAPAGPRSAVLLVSVANSAGRLSSFGEGAGHPPGFDRLATAVETMGFRAVSPLASGRPAIPLTDLAARDLAAAVGAHLAVVAEVSLAEVAKVRVAERPATLARARLRIVGRISTIGTGDAVAGGVGEDVATAADAAVGASLAAALELAVGNDRGAPIPEEPGQVFLRASGMASWRRISELRRNLAAAAGIQKVAFRRFAQGEVVLAVATKHKAERLAQVVKGVEPAALVDSKDGAVELVWQGD